MLTPNNPFSFQYALQKDKLNGSNFLHWYRNPRIVLKQEFKPYLEDLKKKKTFETSSRDILCYRSKCYYFWVYFMGIGYRLWCSYMYEYESPKQQ